MVSLHDKLSIISSILVGLHVDLDDCYQEYSHKENDFREAGKDDVADKFAWAMWQTKCVGDLIDDAILSYITSGKGLDD